MSEQDQSNVLKIKASEREFLSYWQEIDIIREFNVEELEGTLDQPVRKAIINILSEGRKITDTDGNEQTIRVMNAAQLLDAINEIAKDPSQNKYGLEPIKRSNLYYHINALAEKEFIQEVGRIPKKNRLISYYGRTARVFLLNYDEDKKSPMPIEKEGLPQLIKAINPSLSEDKIDEVITGLQLMHKKVNTDPIHGWVKENEQQLRQSDVDIRTLHNIFYKILAFDDKTIEAMREFAKAMKLNINDN